MRGRDRVWVGVSSLEPRMRNRERQRDRRREKQAPYREPNAGLDPRTLVSGPGPKADAQPPSHPGVPVHRILRCI